MITFTCAITMIGCGVFNKDFPVTTMLVAYVVGIVLGSNPQ